MRAAATGVDISPFVEALQSARRGASRSTAALGALKLLRQPQAMRSFSFCLALDGEEASPLAVEQPDRRAAMELGKILLTMALRVRQPKTARLAIFDGTVEEGESVGRWDWSFAAADAVWRPDPSAALGPR